MGERNLKDERTDWDWQEARSRCSQPLRARLFGLQNVVITEDRVIILGAEQCGSTGPGIYVAFMSGRVLPRYIPRGRRASDSLRSLPCTSCLFVRYYLAAAPLPNPLFLCRTLLLLKFFLVARNRFRFRQERRNTPTVVNINLIYIEILLL